MGRRIDYSGEALAPLEESGVPGISGGLDENTGVSGAAGSLDVTVFYADGGATVLYAPSNGTPVDWNNNGAVGELHVIEDVSGDGSFDVLSGFNDWAGLNYAFQCAVGTWQDSRGPSWTGPRELGFQKSLARPRGWKEWFREMAAGLGQE